MKKNEFGVWKIVLPANNGQPAIPHNSKIKVRPHLACICLHTLVLSNLVAP